MKYLFTIWVAFWLTFTLTLNNVIAEESPFEGRHIVKPIVYTECQAGFLFVVAASQNGVSIMQVFKDAGDMVPKPVECEQGDE